MYHFSTYHPIMALLGTTDEVNKDVTEIDSSVHVCHANALA